MTSSLGGRVRALFPGSVTVGLGIATGQQAGGAVRR